ncbi:glucose 1-dehydrogenase [Candidatus Lucifugimonas marina]|uniref:Glucose 1-dehydrogenase n=2 Tax=Candidatus Lucifugimonas marina TaxID=3038979 RepID=A0AAJ6CVB6_9CHLR|nr:glucose 1-dehydrogenase [SAR202 cluster bacterium JH702]MDG0870318.1 glucose 1-dehydrogenase [SAR202 cluster bacterium JH639]WFG36124.1 glucose 1-dehydrogenase [SAR202 cluster bacterium JH545]WFG40069.1 glucose 1-dehydrogenase [SAR202 cluster bacterium JH1073]
MAWLHVMEIMDFEGKTAVVTGGARGIGRGIALELAQRGSNVLIADTDEEAARDVVAEIKAGGTQSSFCETDVTQQWSTDDMVEVALEEFGQLDVLVNNAGVGGAIGFTKRKTPTVEDWQATFDVNVFGIVNATQSVESYMVERGYGKIVNIASIAGRGGRPGFATYAASKAAAVNVSQAWAFKLAPHGINVNTVCPGLIWTPLWEKIAEWRRSTDQQNAGLTPRQVFQRTVAEMVPLGREQTTEDVGKAVAFLASDRARSITGQALNVDGGIRQN